MTKMGGFRNRAPCGRIAPLASALLIVVVASAAAPRGASGQIRDSIVSAGAHYAAGGLHRFFFGGDYRALWTTPIRVRVLNLQTYGGGLTPTTAGGGFQTKSLRFRGTDGFEYGFRSIDKDPGILPEGLQGTMVEDLVQDQISSAYPPGPAVAAALMRAAGLLHTDPELVLLPDDPALGEFRERFAGTLGFIEARAITGPGLIPFANAAEIIDGDDLFELVQRSSNDLVDSRALLRARLFDVLIGDWDRHRGQWGWARFGDDPVTIWVPVPEDRDQAFVRFDGLVLSMARITTPQLTAFGEDYGSMVGLTWNGREVDRRFLVPLERPTWDSVTSNLVSRLTDSVIDAAVQAMPREYQSVDGERLAHTLKTRRDKLAQAAGRFYRLLASEPNVHGTDQADLVAIDRQADGTVEITLSPREAPSTPYFRRRFHRDETKDVRIYLHAGDDRVVANGGRSPITIRIIGGTGNDEVGDASGAGGLRFYTADGDGAADRVKVDRRPFVLPPKKAPNEVPPRDWGSLWRVLPWGGFGPDVGLFVGGGLHRIDFGFRHLPFASKVRVRGGYSTGANTGRAQFTLEFHRSNSRVRAEVDVLASGIEVLRFHGFGNETLLTGPNDDEFYRVVQRELSFRPSLILPLGRLSEISFGPVFNYYDTDFRQGRFLSPSLGLSGTGTFGQVGGRADVYVDTRDVPAAATRGVWFTVGGSVYPEVWDVATTYGEAHGEFATYFTADSAPLRPTVAVRAGAKKVWGSDFPFQQGAFIGDAATVRLARQNRFGGDAAAYGNVELRLDLAPAFIIIPGRIGIHGIADVGRVWLDGEESDRWHPAFGGGIWLSFLSRVNTLSATVTRSEVGTSFPGLWAVYIQAGFAY